MASSRKYWEQLFELRFTMKRLEKASKKSERQQKRKEAQVLGYLRKGNVEAARVIAGDAVRLRRESHMYQTWAAKVDGVRSRFEAAEMNTRIAQQLQSTSKEMEKHLLTMDLQQLTTVFDKFEKQCEDWDVQDGIVHQSLAVTTSSPTSESEVKELMRRVADENAVDIQLLLPDLPEEVEEKEEVPETAQRTKPNRTHQTVAELG